MKRAPIFNAVAAMVPGIWNKPGLIAQMDALLDAAGVSDIPSAYPFPISAIDAKTLKKVAPANVSEAALEAWVEPIQRACLKYEINTIRRIAAFITTLAHEGGFAVGKRENMNYRAQRLAEVWPGRFAIGGKASNGPNPLALSLGGKPEEIANHVYANRMGNGPPQSGDGWKYRGNGPPQLTGADNHRAFAEAIGKSVDDAVEYIGTLEGGIEAAAWFWEENDINRLADTPGISDETKRINGGTVGIGDRQAKFNTLVDELLAAEKIHAQTA